VNRRGGKQKKEQHGWKVEGGLWSALAP
jgi:hypothetical protein